MTNAIRAGCGVWGNKEWVGRLYTQKTNPNTFLRQYASAFDAVEGNTSFYRTPSEERIHMWKDAVTESFRFCFKFPQEITHKKSW